MRAQRSRCLALILASVLIMAPCAFAQSDGLERSPSTREAGERALTLYHDGREALDRGELAEAAQHFRRALSLDQALDAARRDYARILITAGRPERAQTLLAQGIALPDPEPATARLLARTARDNGNLRTAIRALERIHPRVDPDDRVVRANLAALHRQQGDHLAAASLYAELRDAHPTEPQWILGEAVSRDHAGQATDAHAAWSALTNHDGLDPAIQDHASARIRALEVAQLPSAGD
ncbi:tetratricopeptide repeat protein [Spiribacter sp. 2438]|uniref:tetratricopeptide repeat protein n=1 Tax=Spiribacter sp. 2438 TaxID=2666185 RepID=UPI0012B0E0E8|nr:tetratricopeptide repeat protein [Spiribacter sp. 2438]QGM21539.1 tetratricopeptide repeat protein [Spiribacter sp. 2438]